MPQFLPYKNPIAYYTTWESQRVIQCSVKNPINDGENYYFKVLFKKGDTSKIVNYLYELNSTNYDAFGHGQDWTTLYLPLRPEYLEQGFIPVQITVDDESSRHNGSGSQTIPIENTLQKSKPKRTLLLIIYKIYLKLFHKKKK